jgi:hypothetical protein
MSTLNKIFISSYYSIEVTKVRLRDIIDVPVRIDWGYKSKSAADVEVSPKDSG